MTQAFRYSSLKTIKSLVLYRIIRLSRSPYSSNKKCPRWSEWVMSRAYTFLNYAFQLIKIRHQDKPVGNRVAYTSLVHIYTYYTYIIYSIHRQLVVFCDLWAKFMRKLRDRDYCFPTASLDMVQWKPEEKNIFFEFLLLPSLILIDF